MKRFWTDLWWLMLYVAFGLLLVFAVMYVLQMFCGVALMLHLTQWSQNILAMLLPGLLWVRYYKKERVCETMRLGWPGWQVMGLVALLMVVSAPAMDALASGCERIPWPDAVIQMANANKVQQEAVLRMLLDVDGVGGWLELVMLMCVMTAIGEEMLFRGALLRCFGKSFSGLRLLSVSLWVGLIFAAIHVEVFGLIPRWLLGAAFVGLVCRTGSIWPAVLAHAMNNLWALLSMKFEDTEKAPSQFEKLLTGAYGVSLSVVLSAMMIWWIIRVTGNRNYAENPKDLE